MAKKARKAKVQKPQKTLAPMFGHGQHIGNGMDCLIVADASGKVWRFDLGSGEARPVLFSER